MGVNPQQRAAPPDEQCCSERCCESGLAAIPVLLLFSLSFYLIPMSRPLPRYSVAIGAVSGLDPDTDMQDGCRLDLAFNLIVCIDASLNGNGDGESAYYLQRSTSAQVSYFRVPLAVGRVPEPGNDTCVAPGSRKDLAVVARGRGVAMPGFLLDSLAEDMRRGEAVFEVTLMSPGGGGWNVMTCWGKAGDDATLQAPCDKS